MLRNTAQYKIWFLLKKLSYFIFSYFYFIQHDSKEFLSCQTPPYFIFKALAYATFLVNFYQFIFRMLFIWLFYIFSFLILNSFSLNLLFVILINIFFSLIISRHFHIATAYLLYHLSLFQDDFENKYMYTKAKRSSTLHNSALCLSVTVITHHRMLIVSPVIYKFLSKDKYITIGTMLSVLLTKLIG